MISATEKSAPDFVTAAVWIGFAMMCIGMFMAVLDVQVVATSLPTIQRALNIPQIQMSWIQTAYLIAEVISIPLTGFLTRALTMRWLFVGAVSVFTLASIACAASGNFSTPDRVSHRARFLRRHADPGGLLGYLSAFSSSAPAIRNDDRRGSRCSCSDRGTDCGRLDYRDLFLAVAIPHQCRARDYRSLGRDGITAEGRCHRSNEFRFWT